MPFIAEQPQAYVGQLVGSGHCVDYVKAAAGCPHTSQWLEGMPVWEAVGLPDGGLPAGTAIATFDENGRYANATDGSSHAAIFVEEDGDGIWVCDQWNTGTEQHPVALRLIRAKGGVEPACDDSGAYSVIEAEDG